MKKLFVICLTVLLSSWSFAQTKLKGRVTDQTQNPVVGVSVSIKGLTEGTITDADGSFSFTTTAQSGEAVISFIGYTSQNISFNLEGGAVF